MIRFMRKTLTFILLAILVLPPQTLTAQDVCSVSAMDTVAGLGTQILLDGCESGATVRMTTPDGGVRSYQGNGTINVPGADVRRAGEYGVEAGGGSAVFTVLPDVPDAAMSRLTSTDTHVSANGSVTVTLSLLDRFGNALSGRPAALLSNRAEDEIVPATVETDEYGEMRWTVRSNTPGQITLTAYDILSGRAMSDRVTLNGSSSAADYGAYTAAVGQGADFGFVDRFSVQILDKEVIRSNEDLSLRITALDTSGNVVEDYTGTVEITSTDTEAVLPGGGLVTFRPAELGRKEIALGMRFRTPGEQTLTVADQSDPAVRGSISINVERLSGDGNGDIEILDPPDGTRVGDPTILLQGRGPSFVNLRVKGGAEEVSGSTDAEGVFRIEVPLNPAQTDHTLFVVSDNGRYESRAHHLVFDTGAPDIESITFDPEEGQATMDATITVVSEPGLASVTAEIGSKSVTLAESASGTYAATFTAPASGVYDAKVTVTDGAGNEATMLAKWTVEGKGMPTVQGVAAQGRPNAVLVTWQPVDDEDLAQYRVYIGTSAQNYEYGLDTGSPVTSALVNGLTPGVTYTITVTALGKDGEESTEKSVPVTATPLGMSLRVMPGNESLLMEWQPPANTPLATYILEYGVDAGAYSERRKISGDLRVYTIRDLLNGVTYELKLTPVTITGQRIEELATVAHGTPSGEGFGLGPADPAPIGPVIVDPEDPLHSGAPIQPPRNLPSTPDSGIPSFVIWSVIFGAAVLGIGVYKYRRQRRLLMKFMSAMDREYHSR